MKRKADEELSTPPSKKKASDVDDIRKRFSVDLSDQQTLDSFTLEYANSKPYKHAVIKDLIAQSLLRKVRSEIQDSISFTPKETDIYRIHQSGDLANLDGLDDASLQRLPSLLSLRDALYSEAFRTYVSQITKSGPLSGKKTDMAVNVYTPGCHLLCHDDVIGSRRVSYILYLTDPENPWKKEWGGALRFYPTQTHTAEGINERPVKVPLPDWSVSIPPSFNQLSFFAVQPGESFHDVEEVYAHEKRSDGEDGKTVRMAISGWYHIPQEGEPGYEPGAEEKLAEQSSLQQLQGKGDEYDLPRISFRAYEITAGHDHQPDATNEKQDGLEETQGLTEQDLDFLVKYLNPVYLTPDTLDSVSDAFTEQCSLLLSDVLHKKFADQLREFLTSEEERSLPTSASEIKDTTVWNVARPPYKHRYLYQQPSAVLHDESSSQTPLYELLNSLLPSVPFRKWLQLATHQNILSHNVLARRFRRGQDYTLATSYDEKNPRLELCFNITPTPGWGSEDEPSEGNDKADGQVPGGEAPPVGGYLAYMVGDENPKDPETGSDHDVRVPTDLSTGGRASGSIKTSDAKHTKADPAVYQATGDEEDDGVLFSTLASWNQMALVLRDKGTMRFVKYVSKQAKGDRWDLLGEFEIEEVQEEEDDDGEATTERADDPSPTIDTRGGFHGYSEDSEDSD
ncbi:MAG: hypothetical protein Q9191_005955 [Dirinaria sp. TL-2023a]